MITKTALAENVFLLHNVLDEATCKEIIEASEAIGFKLAPITTSMGPLVNTMVRNNKRVIDFNKSMAEAIWSNVDHFFEPIADFTPVGLNEMFRIYRYEMGEQFNKHRDGAYKRNAIEHSIFTFIIYLNDDFEGGETAFDKFSVQPEPGMALCFHHPLRHKGNMVESGIKYALRTDVMYRLQ